MYDIIYELVSSKDLLEANSILKKIDEALTNQSVNRSTFCRKLSQTVVEWTVMSRSDDIFATLRPKYHIYKAPFSVPPYLASFGLTERSYYNY